VDGRRENNMVPVRVSQALVKPQGKLHGKFEVTIYKSSTVTITECFDKANIRVVFDDTHVIQNSIHP